MCPPQRIWTHMENIPKQKQLQEAFLRHITPVMEIQPQSAGAGNGTVTLKLASTIPLVLFLQLIQNAPPNSLLTVIKAIDQTDYTRCGE